MYKSILKEVTSHNAKLIAVSKTKPVESIATFYELGQINFGENKVQELVSKYDLLPKDINWHMIGSLQSNKIKLIAPWVYLIHSADRPSIIKKIDKEGRKINRKIPILLQIKLGHEPSKHGFSKSKLLEFLDSPEFKELKSIKVKGVMGMASFVSDPTMIRNEFKALKSIYNQLKQTIYSEDQDFCEISMGMSADYKIALEEGATYIRVGSALFGSRH